VIPSKTIQGCCLLAALAATARPAGAEENAKGASSAFKACREQEKYGDATSCWRAWLDRHQSTGHEAEVLYAEEKVTQGGTDRERESPMADEAVDPREGGTPAKSGSGLSVIAHGAAAGFFLNEPEQRFVVSPTRTATFSVPSFGYGGGLSVGYEIGRLIGWRETHVRLGAERLVGTGDGTGAGVTHADLTFEKGFPLGQKLKLYFALGPSLTLVELKIVPPGVAVPDQTREVQEVTSTRFGGAGRAGVELALASRLAARLEAAGRINTRGFYAPDEGSVIYWDFDRRRDSFSTAGVRLGLVAMF
jgi:opacity protein-like surface antigen